MYAMDQDLYNVKGSTTTTVLILSVSPCHHEVKKDAIVVMERAGLVRNNKELAHFARYLSQDAPEKSIYHLAIEVSKTMSPTKIQRDWLNIRQHVVL
jgi:hypothetical protein